MQRCAPRARHLICVGSLRGLGRVPAADGAVPRSPAFVWCMCKPQAVQASMHNVVSMAHLGQCRKRGAGAKPRPHRSRSRGRRRRHSAAGGVRASAADRSRPNLANLTVSPGRPWGGALCGAERGSATASRLNGGLPSSGRHGCGSLRRPIDQRAGRGGGRSVVQVRARAASGRRGLPPAPPARAFRPQTASLADGVPPRRPAAAAAGGSPHPSSTRAAAAAGGDPSGCRPPPRRPLAAA